MKTAEFDIRVQVVSEANQGKFTPWTRIRRAKRQKDIAYTACFKQFGGRRNFPGRYSVDLIRIKGKRQRDFDGDNLQSAFKAVRDGIAKYMQIDDGSDRLTWHYRQEKGDWAGVGVEIRKVET